MNTFDPFASGAAVASDAPDSFDPFGAGLAQESAPASKSTVPVEALFQGVDKIDGALPQDARTQLQQTLRGEADPNGFKMRAANTAFLADRYGKPVEEVAGMYEQYRDAFAKDHLHELKPLDDAGFYGKIGGKLQKEKDERVMLNDMTGALFGALREGKPFNQAFEEQKKTRWQQPGWDAFNQDYYREFARKQWQYLSDSKDRLQEPIQALAAYMDQAKRGIAPGQEDQLIAQREKVMGLLQSLPEQDARLAMDFAATQAQGDTKSDQPEGFVEKTARRLERGVTGFAENAAGAVKEEARRFFMSPTDAATSRRRAQLERQLDQRIRGEVDPLKGEGWVQDAALNVAQGMPQFVSVFSVPGIVANFAATKEELRGHFEDQGISANKSDLLSGIAAVPQTALNFVSSKMALGVIPGASRFLTPVTEAGFVPLAKQAGKYLAAESIIQPILNDVSQLTPSAVQVVAKHYDDTIPGIPGGFMSQVKSVARSTPETFASLLPFILIGAGAGTFHDRAAGKAYLQDRTRLEAVGLKEEAIQKVLEAPTPESASIEIQNAWTDRSASTAQKEALQKLDAQALKSRAAHGDSFSSEQAALISKYAEVLSSIPPDHIPVEIQRADGSVYPAAMNGYWDLRTIGRGEPPSIAYNTDNGWTHGQLKEGEKILSSVPTPEQWAAGMRDVAVTEAGTRDPSISSGDGQPTVFENKMVEEWRKQIAEEQAQKLKVTRSPDDSYTVTTGAGELVGTAASAEGAARIVEEQGFADMPTPADQSPPAEAALSEALAGLEGNGQSISDVISEKIRESQKMGIVAGPPVGDLIFQIGRNMSKIFREIRTVQKFTQGKQALAEWVSKRGRNSLEIQAVTKEIRRVAPTAEIREGITNWIQANGDREVLQQRANDSTKLARKLGYEAALKLNPEQLKLAQAIQKFYADKLKEAQAHGIVDNAVENYVNQVWDRPSLLTGKSGSEFRAKLNQNFKFAKERTFGSFFEGEQAGFTPKTKDIAHLFALYSNELNKVIATRELIKDLTMRKAEDGRPLAAPVGSASEAEGDGGTATMVKPTMKPEDARDYRTVDNPALSKWKWVGGDEGKPVLLQGQLGLHPEIYKYVRNALGRSEIKNWYESDSETIQMAAAKAFVGVTDKGLAMGKATMLGGISTFHAIHEVKRVAGNRINPFKLPELNPNDPVLKRAMDASLMIAGDNDAMRQFEEGLGGASLVDRIPVLGKASQFVSEFTFHELIPKLKFKLWQALVERNSALYENELATGQVTQKDIDYLSARQANARLGHLNYVDLGRNPTLRHIMSVGLLAPDFWESNIRNYGQAIQGALSKTGREPALAFALTAACVFVASRIMNELLDGDPHLEEPFGVVHNNRVYTMRNEVEDLWRAVKNTRTYIAGRLSPISGFISDALRGTNWRGEKQSTFDSFKDFLMKEIPISARWIPGLRDLTETGRNARTSAFQDFLSSQGVQVAGASKINDAYKIAHQYYADQGGKEDKGVYPTSKYQQLRYALEDGDEAKAKKAIAKLLKENPDTSKLQSGFHSSLFHPFTGSKAMDDQMKQALKPEELKKIEQAEELRRQIYEHFTELIQE